MTSDTTGLASCGAPRRPIPVSARGRHLVVDVHCHMGSPEAEAIVRAQRGANPPLNPRSAPRVAVSASTREVNRRQLERVAGPLNGIDERIAEMDRLGVDIQVVSPSPGQYYYETEPEVGRAAAKALNDRIAEAAAERPDRLVGMGTVPLQAPELAVTELKRLVGELDLRGVEICTNVNGKDLSDPALRPFFAAAEALGIVVFIHPMGFLTERFAQHYFSNVIGNPLESTLAVGHLIFGGVLEACPGLKVCVAHGGGYLPAYFGRMDHAARAREDCREHIKAPPSTYLRRIWLDTLVHDKAQRDFLIATHGADRLCLGSDYPFDMGEPDPVGFHEGLDETVKARILGLNAAELFGLTVGAHQDSPPP
jgi:aminocarboxymuconate-semialdehyde decarboxylase